MNTDSQRPEDVKTKEEREFVERQSRLQDILLARENAFLEEEETLFTWEAPARAFKTRNKEYFTTIGAIVILVCLILLFLREFLLMAVVISISFVSYVFATVKPEKVTHEISTRGIRTGGKFLRWDELGRYWFEEKFDQQILYVETFLNFPKVLMMLTKDQEKITKILTPYLLKERPEDGFVDKASVWLQEKVPLESS